MADLPPNQKRTVARYASNRGYFRGRHYWRSLRFVAFAIAVAGSLAVVATWHWWGPREVFSTGPISENHARFANDCRVCHLEGNAKELTAQFELEHRVKLGSGTTLPAATDLSLMDRACIQCHPTKTLHLPHEVGLVTHTISSEMNLVHATACASCHREHVGHGRMPASDPQRCVDCHANEQTLRSTRQSLKLAGHPIAAAGENLDLGDGLRRFLTPPRPAGTLPAFASYAAGHPPFAWEAPGVKDPGVLKFNHERHLRSDIPAVDGHRLDCASCHQPGPGHEVFQPVKYEEHCAQCHSLQIQPDLPKVTIPHGDPEKVRYFLASLNVAFAQHFRTSGLTESFAVDQRVAAEQEGLRRRGLQTLDDLEKRVFLEGDPMQDRSDRRPRAGARKFLTECAKCHEVGPVTPTSAPKVTLPNLAERWTQRGPFTHAPHQHVDCLLCHGAAAGSTLTSDILLPPQKLCVECHRPADAGADRALLESANGTHATAQAQRMTGGVKWDCLSCHGYHAPADAQRIIEKITAPPPPPKIARE